MSRRVKLPGADELFRPTKPLSEGDTGAEPSARRAAEVPAEAAPVVVPTPVQAPSEETPAAQKAPSGRVKHDEKITVYVTADELLDLEHTRLLLRRDHGVAVDRGRIVREAIHLALAGVEADGDASPLVRRLREQ
jgi:hypothetical protein